MVGIFFITDFAGSVVKINDVVWNVVAYAVAIIIIDLIVFEVQNLILPVARKT